AVLFRAGHIFFEPGNEVRARPSPGREKQYTCAMTQSMTIAALPDALPRTSVPCGLLLLICL
ncbi:MAG: hypothetical protein AAF666_21080, partial [Pseudomonadota bacterium]